jgi:hypothetical protein
VASYLVVLHSLVLLTEEVIEGSPFCTLGTKETQAEALILHNLKSRLELLLYEPVNTILIVLIDLGHNKSDVFQMELKDEALRIGIHDCGEDKR